MTHLNGRHCLSCTELFVELEVTGEMTFSGWGKQQVQDVVKAMGRGTKVNVHLFSTTLFYTHKAVYIIKRNSWNCKKHTHTQSSAHVHTCILRLVVNTNDGLTVLSCMNNATQSNNCIHYSVFWCLYDVLIQDLQWQHSSSVFCWVLWPCVALIFNNRRFI